MHIDRMHAQSVLPSDAIQKRIQGVLEAKTARRTKK